MQKMMQIKWVMLLTLVLVGLTSVDCFAQKKKKKNKGKKAAVEQKVEEKKVVEDPNVDTSAADALLSEDKDLWGPDSSETIKNYSLYREFFKQKAYDDAFPYWEYVMTNAPKARKTPYLDGEKMYVAKLEALYTTVCKDDTELEGWQRSTKCKENGGFKEYKISDEEKAEEYMNKIEELYANRVEHFGEEGYIYALRSRLIKNYKPELKDSVSMLRDKSIEIDAESSLYDIVYYQFRDLVSKFKKKEVNADQFEEKYDEYLGIMQHNAENHEKEKTAAQYEKYGEKMESWREKYEEAVAAKADNDRKMASDCPTIKEVWGGKYRENPNDLKTVKTVYSKFRRAGCKSDPMYMELMKKMYDLEPKGSLARFIAVQFQKSKDYTTAMTWYKKSLETETDVTKNASTYLKLAKMEQIKGNYSQARNYAREAIKMRAGWGAPYMLIGNLYASSGKKVQDGLGGRSVYWVAVDMYAKAKDIDPSVAGDAQTKINKYAGAFPTKEDVFLKLNKSKGAPFVVGGWIQQRTRIR